MAPRSKQSLKSLKQAVENYARYLESNEVRSLNTRRRILVAHLKKHLHEAQRAEETVNRRLEEMEKIITELVLIDNQEEEIVYGNKNTNESDKV